MSATEKLTSNISNDLDAFKRSNQKIGDSSNSRKLIKKRAPENKLITFLASRPKWLWILTIMILAIITAASLATTLVVFLYNPTLATSANYSMNSTAGKPCTASSDCITDAYCNIPTSASIGVCNCVITSYYDPNTAACLPRQTVNQPCLYSYQCLEYKRLTCITSTCQCDSTSKFWNSTALECQYLKVPFGLCTSTSPQIECIANSVCWPNVNSMGYNKCLCGTMWNKDYWWYNTNTGVCETTKLAGVQCTADYECVNFAYCTYTVSSPTKKVCVCDTKYYQHPNGWCYVKYGYTSGCSFIDQCNLNQNNLRCISGTCRCDLSAEVWDTFYQKCVPLKTYGQTCSSSTDCISGFTCAYPPAGNTRKACICSSSQYFDWVSGTCQTTKAYNSICYSRAECNNQDTMVCMATSGGTTKRCLCAPNYAYQSSTTCVLKKTMSSSCSAVAECQDYLGFDCAVSCNCPSTKMYDSITKKCLPRKRRYSYCSSSSECASNCCHYCATYGWAPVSNTCY
jgi:hypothetical protein